MTVAPSRDRTLSRSQARRVALAAQGFLDRPHAVPTMRTLARTVARTGVLQIDSVNVLQRAHYMPLFSRMGPYDPELLHRAAGRAPRRLVEYWAHEAAFMPVDLWPYMRHRMARARSEAWGGPRRIFEEKPDLVAWVLDEVRERGPISARDIEGDLPRANKDNWGWNWSETKQALEFLFFGGEVSVARRNAQFERMYDVPERVLPAEVLAVPVPTDQEAHRELVRRAAAAHGVATEACLRDYYRMRSDHTRAAIDALVEDGELEPVWIEGWARPAYLHRAARLPRRVAARALLSPFDPVVWERGRTDVPAIVADLKRQLAAGYRVLVAAESQGSADRIREILAGHELFLPQHDGGPLEPARGAVAVAPIDEGFSSETLGLSVVGEGDLFGKRRPHREPKAQRRRVTQIEVEPGDLAVHVVHGVGRYLGMETREIGDSRADYLVLEYAEGDRLYLPADQLDLVSRYIGGELPKLHRLGGSEWNRQKSRVKKAVKDIAGELVKLYAARAQQPGFAFSMDQPWQRELEDAFPYMETRDQLAAIDDVKADMERASPMDRLICGDVGYGKTEIALRAAFKAVLDGKQVAVLVPTTLLAQQHFATFTERFAPFPVRVASLSRWVAQKDLKKALEDITAGKVDIVIGTHRLLQKDVQFADLGLLIVDEEQRFGVTHKEALKKLKTNVDVLTLTATPIPRTLEMSLSGIRDLSVVDTPPEDRHPVLTFVGPFDEQTMAAAIRREMLREGQVFYVHDRVQGIEAIALRIRTLVPEARVGIAHGQMNERQLEKVMLEFWDKAYDVLLTTTIIESGLDIPTANTLIVDRADRLGLAQLYQLRGRVGRSRERAYAYFFFPVERELTEQSHARLAAISQFTDLGSGMQIALRDLEIRGAGNLLGGEQHGHIATVGFDLYVRLLAEAVDEAKGQKPEIRREVKIDLPVDAHLPESWIDKEPLRLEAYRRIAEAPTLEALEDARKELLDRFGPLPPQAETLLTVAALRIEIGPRGVRTVSFQNRQVRLEPFVLAESEQVRVRYRYPGSIFKPQTYTVVLPVPRDVENVAAWLLEAARDILSS